MCSLRELQAIDGADNDDGDNDDDLSKNMVELDDVIDCVHRIPFAINAFVVFFDQKYFKRYKDILKNNFLFSFALSHCLVPRTHSHTLTHIDERTHTHKDAQTLFLVDFLVRFVRRCVFFSSFSAAVLRCFCCCCCRSEKDTR